jgi:hypothetical protein
MKTMIALLLLAAPLAAQDVVRFRDPAKNPDLEGEIVTLTCKAVEIEVLVDGVRIKRAVDARDIADLVPRKSIDLAKAEEALANGDLNAVIQRFERVAGDPRAGELSNQSAAIRIVRTHAEAGNHAAALQSARALRARKQDGYYVGESYQLEVKTLLAMQDPKQAAGRREGVPRARQRPGGARLDPGRRTPGSPGDGAAGRLARRARDLPETRQGTRPSPMRSRSARCAVSRLSTTGPGSGGGPTP